MSHPNSETYEYVTSHEKRHFASATHSHKRGGLKQLKLIIGSQWHFCVKSGGHVRVELWSAAPSFSLDLS